MIVCCTLEAIDSLKLTIISASVGCFFINMILYNLINALLLGFQITKIHNLKKEGIAIKTLKVNTMILVYFLLTTFPYFFLAHYIFFYYIFQ